MTVRPALATLALVLATPAAAVSQAQQPMQAAPVPATPAECLQSASDGLNKAVTAAQKAGAFNNANYAAMRGAAQKQAASCAATFSVEKSPSSQLTSLSTLYSYIGDTTNAHRALDRAMEAKDLSARDRATSMIMTISRHNRAANAFAGLVAPSEALVKKIDAFPDSLSDLKIRAHQTMLGQYEYADNDHGIQSHAQAIVTLGRRVNDKRALISAFASLARAAGDFLKPDSALMILDAAERELGSSPEVTRGFERHRTMYRLVGTKATPITGERWLNAPDVPAEIRMGNGKVTLVQFTAHWCAPCRNSYPGMLELAARFAKLPYEVLFVTDLYGNFEGKRMTAEEELAADKTYYVDHHAIPFKVAINSGPKPGQTTADRALTNDGRYAVQGIPEIVIIDKRGIIRQVIIGWDAGNTKRLMAFIDQLQREAAM